MELIICAWVVGKWNGFYHGSLCVAQIFAWPTVESIPEFKQFIPSARNNGNLKRDMYQTEVCEVNKVEERLQEKLK